MVNYKITSLAANLLAVIISGLLLDRYYPNLDIWLHYAIIFTLGFFTSIIHDVIIIIFTHPHGNRLVDVMAKCKLRKVYGLNYCGVCENGYECAGGKL
jgi:hypothetical protein